jgi:uncharacterized protein YabE (DUF348 family)
LRSDFSTWNQMNINRFALAIILSFIVVLSVIFIQGFKSITITINGQEFQNDFFGFTVADALRTSGIIILDDDAITPKLNEIITNNQKISISRAFWVLIVDNNTVTPIRTNERLPQKILSNASIKFNPGDQIFSNGLRISPNQPLPYEQGHVLHVNRGTELVLEVDNIRSE